MEFVRQPVFWYAALQLGVMVAFAMAALRAWHSSRAKFVELITAFLFGLLLEQGDIWLFGTYRYNENWVLLGDVPVAIAMTWALIIAGAMNLTDALGIRDATEVKRQTSNVNSGLGTRTGLLFAAPMADAVWALLLDVAIDAVAIRLGLWTWTIRLDEGWFGVPWGNFFAWLFVAFWFSFFTRLVRAYDSSRWAQWVVPLAAFCGLIAALVPFVALENQAALPFIPDHGQSYNNDVWMIFGLTFALFLGVTWWALLQRGAPRAGADHWLLLMRLGIHGLFLLALLVTGYYLDAPLLLVAAVSMMLVELVFVWYWRGELLGALRGLFKIPNKRTTVQSPRVFE